MEIAILTPVFTPAAKESNHIQRAKGKKKKGGKYLRVDANPISHASLCTPTQQADNIVKIVLALGASHDSSSIIFESIGINESQNWASLHKIV